MDTYHNKVKRNLRVVDSILDSLQSDKLHYHTLFALRTYYSVTAEKILLKKVKFFYIEAAVKYLFYFISYPFTTLHLKGIESKSILGEWHFDEYLSLKTGISQIKPQIIFSFRNFWKRMGEYPFIFRMTFFLLKQLDRRKAFLSLSQIFRFLQGYHVNLKDCKIIIAENDIYPRNYGVLLHARERKITRIKIEYAIIDSVLHQNCFCDLYFYPTTVHRRIREQCSYNKNLKYIEGGYLNKFRTSNIQHNPLPSRTVITYFTEHGNFLKRNDLFYIDEILRILPENGTINVKIHPYDRYERYEKYINIPQVNLLKSTDIDNALLISQSTICLSIFSTMSLEAKYICNNSYFINYDMNSSPFSFDYSIFNSFFDTIDTPHKLKEVINGKYIPATIELFHKNVNMTYPNTFEIFKNFADKCINTPDENILIP